METLEVTEFDSLPMAAALDLVRDVCASLTWQEMLVARRPYGDLQSVNAASEETIAGLAWADVEQALSTHPRIGERAGGDDRESAWSRAEQAGAAGAGADVMARLESGNRDYEQRFGYVFLICATGLTSEQILNALSQRMTNDPDAEKAIVGRELAAIVGIRLAKVLA